MRNIESILQELAENLNTKFLNGDYKIIQIKKYENKIQIEGFTLSVFADTSFPEDNFGLSVTSILDTRFYNSDYTKCEKLQTTKSLFSLGSEKLRMEAWRVWKKKEKEYMEVKGKRDKQKQINRLRKELEELENND